MRNSESRVDKFLSLTLIVYDLYLLSVVDQVKECWIMFLEVVEDVIKHHVIFLDKFGVEEEGTSVINVVVRNRIKNIQLRWSVFFLNFIKDYKSHVTEWHI